MIKVTRHEFVQNGKRGVYFRAEWGGFSWVDWTPEAAAEQVALRVKIA